MESRRRRTARLAVFALIAWALDSGAVGHADPAVTDRLVAVVNEELITASEVDAARQASAIDLLSDVLPSGVKSAEPPAFADMIEALIDQHLLLQEAHTLGLSATEQEAASAFAAVAEQRHLPPAAQSPSPDVLHRLQDQLAIVKLVNREVRSKILISSADIDAYYREHPDQFAQPPRVRISQIFLKAPEGSADLAERHTQSETLRAALEGGAEFGELARANSNGAEAAKGGDLGYFHRGDLLPALDREIEALAEGQISPVIQTPLGFHIIKVSERQVGRVKPLEEVKTDVEEMVYREQADAFYRRWLRQLRHRAHIDIK
ncbi:MAG: peptidylprolyl isomerase [Nitrospirae bacterium]|nr:peptidylprolyl isomerase [Nitrospirota bacterium]